MIKFIADYHKLGIGFIFKTCKSCGNLKIIITRELEYDYDNDIQGGLVAQTCVNSEDFKDEEKILFELTNLINQLLKIDPNELRS